MFIMTARLSKPKLIVSALAVLAVILVVVLIVCGGKEAPSTLPAGGTNEERLAFLAAHGRSVSAAPTETQTVSIPEIDGNDVMERYNALQKSQGFDLTSYVGKDVQRYVYEVLNAPDAKGKVYATLLVYDCRIIGGEFFINYSVKFRSKRLRHRKLRAGIRGHRAVGERPRDGIRRTDRRAGHVGRADPGILRSGSIAV